MSLRTSLVLMILFIVLGSFAIFDPLRREEKEEARKDRESHVLWLKDKKLDKLRVAGKNPTLNLQCELKEGCAFDGTGEWTVTEPVKDKADASATGSLASTLLNLTHNEKIDFDKAPDQAEFGFDLPQAEVTIGLKGESTPIVLKFGKATAVGQNVYLSASTEPLRIFLVPSYLPGMLNKDTFHWRNKRLFPEAEATQISSLGWKTKKLEVRAFRIKDKWHLERPVTGLAGQIMVEGLASSVAFATAKSTLPFQRSSAEGKKLLAAKPEFEILFGFAKGGGHRIQLFSQAPVGPGQRAPKELVAAIDGQDLLYVVDSVTFDRFGREMLEYRERTLIDGNTRNLAASVRFTFPREKRETVYKHDGTQWLYSSGEKLPENISQDRVNAFLDSLRDSEFKAFHPAKGSSAEAKAFRSQTADLYVEIKNDPGEMLFGAGFLVHDRKVALTQVAGDIRVLGEGFLKALPVRFGDLLESANKTVVVKPAEKGPDDGHSSQPEHDHKH